MVRMCLGINREQIIADGTTPLDETFQFGLGGKKMIGHTQTWNIHQGNATVEEMAGGAWVLLQVELFGRRPPERIATQPDHHETGGNIRSEQQGCGNIGDSTNG